jgi:hypothetical protein
MHGIGTALTTNVLKAFECVCKDACYSTTLKMVLTSAGSNRRENREVLNIRVAQQTDLLVDVTLRHDFIVAGHDRRIKQGKLRDPDRPDQIRGRRCRQDS